MAVATGRRLSRPYAKKNGTADAAIIAAIEKAMTTPSVGVLVAAVQPRHPARLVLVAALRHQVHVVVGDVHHVETAWVRRVRVVDLPAVAHEDTHAWLLLQADCLHAAVVVVLFLSRLERLVG